MKKRLSIALVIETKVVGYDPEGISQAMVKLTKVLKEAQLQLNYKSPVYDIKVTKSKLLRVI